MRGLLVLLLFAMMPGLAFAQPAKPNDLPRVLILGDSVYQQPATEVAKTLKGKVNVVYLRVPPGEVRDTTTALEKLEQWLGNEQWDLIHFNFGLGDLIYRAPKMKSFRVLPKHAGGVRSTSAKKYESQLREIVARLKKTNAKLVWASTTPIRHSSTKVFDIGSETTYNAIANKIMTKAGVTTNDMYKFVKNTIDMKKPAAHGADPFFFDRKPIHGPIVKVIAAQLKLDTENDQ